MHCSRRATTKLIFAVTLPVQMNFYEVDSIECGDT
jgi:hypothetical protein